jgi:hypothetical protein
MSLSKTTLLGSVAAVALAVPALAQDPQTGMQKDQYLYQQGQENNLGGANDNAIGATKPNSGPGVQGAPDTRTGPSTHTPGGAESGTSAGESGAGMDDQKTQPSQDSSGVQGFPDTRTGPSTRAPEDGTNSGASGSAPAPANP